MTHDTVTKRPIIHMQRLKKGSLDIQEGHLPLYQTPYTNPLPTVSWQIYKFWVVCHVAMTHLTETVVLLDLEEVDLDPDWDICKMLKP
jgi:hypothetical protein